MLQNDPYHVRVNSKNRISGPHDTNFSVKIDLPTNRKFTHVALVGTSIPKPKIIFEENSIFGLIEDGVASDDIIRIPWGDYSIDNLLRMITTLLNRASVRYQLAAGNLPTAAYVYEVKRLD